MGLKKDITNLPPSGMFQYFDVTRWNTETSERSRVSASPIALMSKQLRVLSLVWLTALMGLKGLGKEHHVPFTSDEFLHFSS